MTTTLPQSLFVVLLLAACSSPRHSSLPAAPAQPEPLVAAQPALAPDARPLSMMELPQTEDGGFVVQPGFYEAEFRTYCLQPGTPDPRQGDAYLQGPVTGYRKEMIKDVLRNSRQQPGIDQKNVQLLLWSMVSGSNFNSLSFSVQRDAARLLTPKQVFELRGGVLGLVREVTYASGLLNTNSDIRRLFERGLASYEAYERLAVRAEPSRVVRPGVKYDQWYRQPEGYYVRYFPENYKKVKIQLFVPDSLPDANHQPGNEYVVFDPTGQQAIPAYTNAQRLGVGAPVLIDIARKVIKIKGRPLPPPKVPEKEKTTHPGM